MLLCENRASGVALRRFHHWRGKAPGWSPNPAFRNIGRGRGGLTIRPFACRMARV
jgi:hypothetical protein